MMKQERGEKRKSWEGRGDSCIYYLVSQPTPAALPALLARVRSGYQYVIPGRQGGAKEELLLTPANALDACQCHRGGMSDIKLARGDWH